MIPDRTDYRVAFNAEHLNLGEVRFSPPYENDLTIMLLQVDILMSAASTSNHFNIQLPVCSYLFENS